MLLGETNYIYIFATFFIDFQGPVQLLGIRTLRMITRVVIGGTGSELDLSAPTWSEEVYQNRVTSGSTGENGKHGFNGPTGKTIGVIWLGMRAGRVIEELIIPRTSCRVSVTR